MSGIRSGAMKRLAIGATLLVTATTAVGLPGTGVLAADVGPTTFSAGGDHSVIVSGGTVYAFGRADAGQLGATVVASGRDTPAAVAGLSGVTAVAAGSNFTLARMSDGTVWGFGSNYRGQLGTATNRLNPTAVNATPLQATGLTDVTAIAAGELFGLAVKGDGTLWGFGTNTFKELANLPVAADPGQITGISNVTAAAAGFAHSLALKSDGTVWSFGSNQYGAAGGVGTFAVPTQIAGLSGISAISADTYFSLALKSDGTVWSFGSNQYGQLGNATNAGNSGAANPTPTQIAGLSGIVAISAGSYHAAAVRSDGTVFTWGYNRSGQLGRATPAPLEGPNPTPGQVPGITNAVAVSAGGSHTLVRTSDGTVLSFGSNDFGALGVPFAQTGTTVRTAALPLPPIAATPSRFVAVTPTRVLDTRPDSAINYSGPKPGAGAQVKVPIIGTAGVPAGATAAVLNITITEATNIGFVQAFPTGQGVVGASSNLNVTAVNQTIPNNAIVPIGLDGSVTLFTQNGGHLLADITGYFVPQAGAVAAGRLVPLAPARIFDTRPASAINSNGAKPGPTSTTLVQVTGRGGVPATGAGAVVLNVTATEATGAGFIQVAPAGALTPGASSSLNLERAGQTIPNQVIVSLGTGGAIEIYSQSGAHLLVDVLGYLTDASAAPGTDGLFVPVAPSRVLDTRSSSLIGYSGAKPGTAALVRVAVANKAGVPATGVSAVATNLTITEASAPGFVQAAPAGTLVPGASSNLNAEVAGQTIPNAAIVRISGSGLDLYTQNGGHLLADIAGWFST